MHCNEALEKTNNDVRAAVLLLQGRLLSNTESPSGGFGRLFCYEHHNGKIGVILEMRASQALVTETEEFKALGREIAMHIAAAKPKSLDVNGIAPELIEAERRVAIEKAKEAGKADAMLEKIAEGTVQKFLKEVTLLSQPFVKDDKQTIEQLLKLKGASVASFTMYVVGEGIEKKVTDFAAEVAAATINLGS